MFVFLAVDLHSLESANCETLWVAVGNVQLVIPTLKSQRQGQERVCKWWNPMAWDSKCIPSSSLMLKVN